MEGRRSGEEAGAEVGPQTCIILPTAVPVRGGWLCGFTGLGSVQVEGLWRGDLVAVSGKDGHVRRRFGSV